MFLGMFLLCSFQKSQLSIAVHEMKFNPLNTELNPICHLLAFAAAPYIYTTLVG
jgi:hypothetical protein